MSSINSNNNSISLSLRDVLVSVDCADPDRAYNDLIRYMDIILEYNKVMNLTAITDRDDFILKHFIDSLTCAGLAEFKSTASVIDVGTGAGFPGMVLAICFPMKRFVLLDSLRKRVNILQEITDGLNLDNVETVHGRAEEVGRNAEYREKYDFAVARAVAPLNVLCEYCLPFVKVGGFFAAMKAKQADDEISLCNKALRILGGKTVSNSETFMKEWEYDHKIILFNKTSHTPKGYPRKPGTPSKEPL